jgi:membrane-bound ClpP family serine protease
MARTAPASSNELVESQLNALVSVLEKTLDGDVLVFVGPIYFGVDDVIREGLESRKAKREKLIVVLETNGGYIEVVQRIADTLRHHYKLVDFIVPNHAMSAGTVLVMSGDAIYMDYYSVLGPIDPQVGRKGGRGMVPALGYLVQFDRLINKSKKGQLTDAELTFLIEHFDPAALYEYEQARELSITLLKQWLVKYKFKNWKRTQTRKLKVTDQMRVKRAREIAERLNKTEVWHSHGRGISMAVLREELNIQIEDFGANPDLSQKILTYHRFLVDYMAKLGDSCVLHTNGRYRPLAMR